MKMAAMPKKLLAFFLSLITLLSTMTIPVFASQMQEGDSSKVSYKWLTEFGQYQTNSPSKFGEMQMFTLNKDNSPIYCMEYAVSFDGSSVKGQELRDTSVWQKLSLSARTGIIRATLYGYPNNTFGVSKKAAYAATQLVLWEYQVGYRTNATSSKTQFTSYLNRNSDVKTAYNALLKKIANHTARCDFGTSTVDLKGLGSSNAVTLTDKNGVLSEFTVKSPNSNIVVSQSGNTLKIYAKNSFTGNVTLTATKKATSGTPNNALALTGAGQVLWYGTLDDPVNFTLKVKISAGTMKIVKTSEDNKISNVSMHISGNNVNKDVKTGSDGTVLVENLAAGKYTVTEKVNGYYEPQAEQSVTIVPGKTTTVTFNNKLKRGGLSVTKTSEDGFNEGHRFHLTGTSDSGLAVDTYAETDSTGKATFEKVLIGSNYTLEEVDTGIQYVVPNSQTVNIDWKTVTNAKFENTLKKFTLTVRKYDSDTNSSQGDSTLKNAVYGIYKGDELIDTYTTDKNGAFTTKEYICGNNWTLKEISPSEGYLLDTTVHHIGAEPGNFTIERNPIAMEVAEDVIKGSIAIIKHNDNGSTQIEHPEVGAEFEVYLKKSGSYEDADKKERDYLVTDENGFAQTKDLPYGVYTVRQVKGYEGVQLMPEFDVTISKNGEIYRYLINNATFESYLKFVKKDAETGKTVPLANTGVQLYDPDGNLIKMSYTYPTPTTIDTFYTNSEGWFVTPEKLKYGKGYSAVEVEAPHGYVLDSTPIYFDVTPNTMSDDNGITVVRISKSDKAQKGTIDITKLAESFTSVRFDGTYYHPVFSLTNNKGAEFKITAAEDITTPDGTIRAKKGEVVDNIIIGNGTTKSKPLYLGKYIVQETKAAPGCVLGNEAYEVTLSYAGQNIEITSSSLTITNERQKAEISLQKTLEQDELFGIGMNGEITNVRFALYCSEKLTASDGTSIPKDGLLEIINMNSDGTAVFNSDIPVGAKLYVQEYAADEHYQLSDKKYPVVFEYAGQETATVHISANNGEAINNELIRGSVLGKKVDEDGFTIAGALFGLFKNDETEFTKENAIMTCESNPIGIFMFKNIPYGNYIVREIQPAPAFALNETNYPVSITSHGQQIEITVENKFITGSVQVMKTDKLTGEKLSGAIFEVYVDVNSDKEYQKDIDKLVGTLDEMGAGIYQMNGLRYNGYFLCEKTAPTGFVKDDNYYYFQIANDLQVITIANGEGTEFVNAPIMGKVRIYKKDSTGKTPLKGAEFAVENSKGELIKTVVTDENGYAEFDLRYGEYFIYEKKAPAGYELNPEKAKINIKNDGQIINITVTNEKIKVEIPNTGADSSLMIYAVAALTISSIAVIVLLVVLRKKKQTKTKE